MAVPTRVSGAQKPLIHNAGKLVAMAASTGAALVSIISLDRKSTRLNSSHVAISYAVFCLKKKKKKQHQRTHSHQNIHHRTRTHRRPLHRPAHTGKLSNTRSPCAQSLVYIAYPTDPLAHHN